MKTNYSICKYCKLFRDWLLAVDNLSLRDIENQLIIMGFTSCSNLASSYAYFLSEYQEHKNNPNFERVMIIRISNIQKKNIPGRTSIKKFRVNSDRVTKKIEFEFRPKTLNNERRFILVKGNKLQDGKLIKKHK